MEYKYCENRNYEDFASGRVLYHANGIPNFPVRLVNEIYRRCLQYSDKKTDICLYDCCCGGGYSLTVLGLLNQDSIEKIIASDIDNKMLEIADKNLSLLTKNGIVHRINEINSLYQQYHKDSHKGAIESAERISALILKDIEVQLFQANALQIDKMDIRPNIIFTDVPYGNLVQWKDGADQVDCLLDSLEEICGPDTIIAVSMDKSQKVKNNASFKRLEKHNIGKRKFEIYIYEK